MDDFPKELMSIVHNHWANYPQQHPIIADAFGICLLILWCASFMGNGLVMFVFLRNPKMRNAVI